MSLKRKSPEADPSSASNNASSSSSGNSHHMDRDVVAKIVKTMSEPASLVLHTSVQVRKPVPKWKSEALLEDGSFGELSSDDFKGQYYVLFFYPGDFTFVCPTEIIEFSEKAEEFKKANCAVIACSVDSKFVHLQWTQTPRNKGGLGKMHIPILADPTHFMSRLFGVHLEDEGLSLRGTFVVDKNGTCRIAHINDKPIGRNVDEALRLVQACQFNDENGEVCPANWRPGAKTMKDNPQDSKSYFSSTYQ